MERLMDNNITQMLPVWIIWYYNIKVPDTFLSGLIWKYQGTQPVYTLYQITFWMCNTIPVLYYWQVLYFFLQLKKTGSTLTDRWRLNLYFIISISPYLKVLRQSGKHVVIIQQKRAIVYRQKRSAIARWNMITNIF